MQDGLISKAKDKVTKALNSLRPVASFGKGLLGGAASDLKANLANIGTGIGTVAQGATQIGADRRYQDLMRSNQLAKQAAFGQGNKNDLLTQSRKIDQGFSLNKSLSSLNKPLAQSMLDVRKSTGMEGSFPGGGGLTTLGRGIAPAARQIALGYGANQIYNAPKALGSYFAPAVGGLLGGVSAGIQGQDIAGGVGRGITSGIRTSGLTSKFTDPLIQKVAGASYIAKLSPVMRQVVGRIATGLGNTAEDEILAKMEGIEPGLGDRALSFGLGALISPTANEQVVDMFLKNNKITGSKAKQVKEVVLENKPGFKKNPNMPRGVVRETNPKMVAGTPKDKNIKLTRYGKPIDESQLNAFGGAMAGIEPEYDENGNVTGYRYNPTKGGIGALAGFAAGRISSKDGTPEARQLKYKTTLNPQDKNDFNQLKKIFSEETANDIKNGKTANWRGTSYEDLGRVNIVSETPKTVEQQIGSKIKDVKLKNNTFYHGTSGENARGIMSSGFKTGSELPESTFRGGGYGQMQNSISLAETPKEASIFSTLSRNGEIVETKLKDNAKVVSIDGVQDAIDVEDYIPYLREKGIDAIYIGGGEKELLVVNPKAVIPVRSQANDAYNQRSVASKRLGVIDPSKMYGMVAGFESYQDENGKTKYRYNPAKGGIGALAGFAAGRISLKSGTPGVTNTPSTPQSTKSQPQSLTQQGESQPLPYKPIIQGTGMVDTSKSVNSELALATRSMFSESDLQTINKLKRASNTKAALEGDIETLRKANPELTAEVLDVVRSVDPTMTDDQALEFVRNLPTKAETTTPRVKEADGSGADVYLAEPKKSFIKLRDAKIEKQRAQDSYKEWQSQLFKSNNTVTPEGKLRNQISSIEQGIKQNTPPAGVPAEKMRDISGFTAYTRDVYRNFKEVYGNNFDKIKRVLLDPFDQAKGDLTRSYQNWSKRINTEVEKKLGVLKGSKESAAVQNFGEGKLTREQLVKQFGEAKAENIVKADTWFRTEYDKLLGEVNQTMARIYPNNPEKIIPRRSDYYRHFKEMGSGISGLMNIFDSPANISSSLAGTSEYVKPKSKWLSFAQERLGNRTEEDAVGGFIDYIKAAEFNKNIDPHTAKFRALAEDLAIQTEKNPKLNNFIEYINDFANDLAGKTNPADRFIQKIIPGGRKTMSVINWVNNRVKANVILGNLSSSVAQIFNVPQGIAEAGLQNSTKGLGLTVANIFNESTPIRKSNFIAERYGGGSFDKFERSMVGNAKKGAAWITGILDEVGTKYIWNSQYAKALADKAPNPIKFADDQTRKLVAGRGIGEVPLIQKSKVFQLVAPFQLEVGNLWHVMGDWVGEKKFGKLATFFIASYVFNKGAEAVRGSDVSIDPIQASIDAFNAFSEEENKGLGAIKAGGRLAGEVLSNIPLAQSAAAIYPEYGFKVGDTQLPTRSDFFGEGDPTRFGSGLLMSKGLQDPLYKLLPPFGGQQFKRTIEGAQATDRGYSESKTGRVRFPVEKTPARNLQRALFGEFSTPAAREYFKTKATVLGEKQSEMFKNLPREQAVDMYKSIIKLRDAKKKSKVKDQSSEDSLVDQAFAAEDTGRVNTRVKPNEYQIEAEKYNLKDSDKEYAKVGDVYLYKDDKGSVRQIDPYKVESMPSATIYEKLKKQKSAYAVVDDVVNSKISPEDKREIYKRLGVSEQEATYYTVAKEDNDLKTAYVLDKIETLGGDRKKMFEILIKGRIEVNKQRVVSDGVLDALSEKGLIDKDELKKLKDLDLDKVTGKPVVKITGRGKGARVKSIKFTPIKVKPYSKLDRSRVRSLGLKSYKLKTTQVNK